VVGTDQSLLGPRICGTCSRTVAWSPQAGGQRLATSCARTDCPATVNRCPVCDKPLVYDRAGPVERLVCPTPGGCTPRSEPGPYDDLSRDELEAEVDGRSLDVAGTGPAGEVRHHDLISALVANDAALTYTPNEGPTP